MFHLFIFQSTAATAGPAEDYQILSPIDLSTTTTVLDFNSTLTSIDVSFEVFDDEVFESATEQFSAQLSTISSALEGLEQGIVTLTVFIMENDGIGLENS